MKIYLILLFVLINGNLFAFNLQEIEFVGGNNALLLTFNQEVSPTINYEEVEVKANLDGEIARFRVVYAYRHPDSNNQLVLTLQRRVMHWHDWANALMPTNATFSYHGNSLQSVEGENLSSIDSRIIPLVDIVGPDSRKHYGKDDNTLYVKGAPVYSGFEKDLWANSSEYENGLQIIYVDQEHSNASDFGDGTESNPFKTIGAAINKTQPGMTIRIKPGIYRESIVINKKGTRSAPIVIEGTTPSGVIISGANDWSSGWTYVEGGISYHSWPRSYQPGDYPDLIGLGNNRENLFVDGEKYEQVIDKESLIEKSYFVGKDRKIYVKFPANFEIDRRLIEVAARPTPLTATSVDYLVLRNLHFTKGYDNNFLSGENFLVEGCSFTWQNFHGLTLKGNRFVIRMTTFDNNGGSGIDFTHSGILNGDNSSVNYNTVIEQCNIRGNNWRIGRYGGQYGEYVGGIKACTLINGIFRSLNMSNNYAPALWLDIHHSNVVIEDSYFYGGLQAVWIEICYGGILIRNNTFINNQSGVEISHSGFVKMDGNLFVDNKRYQIGYGWQGGDGDSRDCCFKSIYPEAVHNIMIGSVINNFSLNYNSFFTTCMFQQNYYSSQGVGAFAGRDFLGWRDLISTIDNPSSPQEELSTETMIDYSVDKWGSFIPAKSSSIGESEWTFPSIDLITENKAILNANQPSTKLYYTLNGYLPTRYDPYYDGGVIDLLDGQDLIVRAIADDSNRMNKYSSVAFYRSPSVSTSIKENTSLSITPSISVYPNPVCRDLNIDFDQFEFSGMLTLQAMNGEMIYNQKIEYQDKLTIDLEKYPAGVYLLRVAGTGIVYSTKIIVTK